MTTETPDPTEPERDERGRNPDGEFERTIVQAELDAQAAYLRASGLTFRQVAERMGCSKATAYQRVKRAIAATPVQSVQELRVIEAERLDVLAARLMAIALEDHYKRAAGGGQYLDRGVNIAAIRELRMNSESRRRIFGVDAPEEIRVTVKDQLVDEIERLAQQLSLTDAEVAEVLQG
jgi:AraC-like DNA-binding protein